MAGAKNHDYHILPPSFWPLLGAFSALAMAAGGIMWMHGGHLSPDKANGGGWIFFLGLAGVLLTMRLWWGDVIKEAHHGDHRSEEHTSELQSLMRNSYAVFCLKKKNT